MTLSLQESNRGVSRVLDRRTSGIGPQFLLVMMLLNIIFRPLHGLEDWVHGLVHGFDDGCGRSWAVCPIVTLWLSFLFVRMVYLLPERVE